MSDTIKRMIKQNEINDREVKRFALTVMLPLMILAIILLLLCYYVGYKDGYKAKEKENQMTEKEAADYIIQKFNKK